MTSSRDDATDRGFDESLWAATAAPAPQTPALAGDARADIAIIGGGYTGLSAALHLAEAGVDVLVLEARQPGWGASGRNGGQVIAGTKYAPHDLVEKLGEEPGRRLAAIAESAPDLVFDLIARHGIACDAEPTGWIKAAHTTTHLAALARWAETLAAAKAPVGMMGREETRHLLGTPAYCGGLRDRRGGTLQPLSYARGLAAAAQRCGARIHGDSPALALNRNGARWIVATPQGSVAADRVILATNAHTDDCWPSLRRTVLPAYSCQIATAPLPDVLRKRILPRRQGVSDTHRLLLYFRWDAHGRLVFGGRGAPRPEAMAGAFAFVERQMRRLFPEAASAPREFAWYGQVALTLDGLPHLCDLAPGVVALLGYNGRGVALATALGKALAAFMIAGDRAAPPLPLRPMRTIPFHAWRRPLLGLATHAYRVLDIARL